MTGPMMPDHGLTPGGLEVTASQGNIDATVSAIRAYCGWHVWPVRVEMLVVDGDGGSVLTLPTLHVTDVESIEENGIALASGLFEWSASGGVQRVDRGWSTRFRGYRVAVTHGYVACPFTALVGSVAAEVANAGNGQITQVGPFQFSYGSSSAAQAILPYRGTLDLYRLPALP